MKKVTTCSVNTCHEYFGTIKEAKEHKLKNHSH